MNAMYCAFYLSTFLCDIQERLLRTCVYCVIDVLTTSILETCSQCLHLVVSTPSPSHYWASSPLSVGGVELSQDVRMEVCTLLCYLCLSSLYADKIVLGEHISLAVTPADDARSDLESRPLLHFGPEGAHMDPLNLPAATVCKRPVYELYQQEAPSPKKLKGSVAAEGGLQDGGCTLPVHCKEAYRRDADEEGVRLEAEEGMGPEAEEKGVGLVIGEEGVGHEAEADPDGVSMILQSGCHEPPVGVHEGDSPFPAALPNESAQLPTSDNGCGAEDDESDDETDSGADESFTCLPHVQDAETAFHTVPAQTLANSHEMENSPLYCLCPVPKDVDVLVRPASTTPSLGTAEMCSFGTRGSGHYIQTFAGNSRVGRYKAHTVHSTTLHTYVCVIHSVWFWDRRKFHCMHYRPCRTQYREVSFQSQ